MLRKWVLRLAACFAACLFVSAGPPAWARPREIAFTRAVFRMDEGVVWGHASGGTNCDVDLEQFHWGREGSEIHTERLGATFSQILNEVGGGPKQENLFEDAPAATDLQIAAAISDMRASVCEQRGLVGYRGSLSMTVQWQVYDPALRQLVGKFETHATGQTSQATLGGLDSLFLAAFRENARDLMSDSGFERLLKTPASASSIAAGVPASDRIDFTVASAAMARSLPQAVQSVVLVLTSDGHGSGFLISPEGYILTNRHVVEGAPAVRIRWADGTEGPGRVLRSDRERDVALVKADPPSGLALALHIALPGQGETVFAIGAPLDPGLQGTLTRGIVSANRVVDGRPFIQSDVAVTHGNSGGPLLNERGEVVGMTESSIEVHGVPLGLNMFIPIGDALRALSLEPRPSKETPTPLVPTKHHHQSGR